MKLNLDLDNLIYDELLEADVCSDSEDESYFDSHIHMETKVEPDKSDSHIHLETEVGPGRSKGLIYLKGSENVRPVRLACIKELYKHMQSSNSQRESKEVEHFQYFINSQSLNWH